MDNNFSNVPQQKYNIPEDAKKYLGEHIVFFVGEENPKVIFHSVDPNEAYKEADKKFKETGKIATVVLIPDPEKELSHIFLHGV